MSEAHHFRVTHTITAQRGLQTVIEVYGVPMFGGPTIMVGLGLEGTVYVRNDLVKQTVVLDKGHALSGQTFAAPALVARVADRLWTQTHAVLLEQEIKACNSKIDNYNGLSKLSDESKDARDFYERLRRALIGLRRPLEGGR